VSWSPLQAGASQFGAVLREDFVEPLNLTQGKAAVALGIDRTSLNELLNGRRNVTNEMALRLGHAFGASPQYRLNLQIASISLTHSNLKSSPRLSVNRYSHSDQSSP